VFREIAEVSPLHRNLTYADMQDGHAIYPYKGEPLRDVMEDIQISKGKNISVADKLYLRIERPLFHSGTLSTKAPALVKIYPGAVARLRPIQLHCFCLVTATLPGYRRRRGSGASGIHRQGGWSFRCNAFKQF